MWRPIQDEETVKKLIGYRVSYQEVLVGLDEVLSPVKNFTVRADSIATIMGRLDTFTGYEIRISGFTRKGDGPYGVTWGGKAFYHLKSSKHN